MGVLARDLHCFEQVADVIGEIEAEYELQRVIDEGKRDFSRKEKKEADIYGLIAWSETPQGSGFWSAVANENKEAAWKILKAK